MIMWKKSVSKMITILLIMMLCLSGCQAAGTNSASEGNNEVEETTDEIGRAHV